MSQISIHRHEVVYIDENGDEQRLRSEFVEDTNGLPSIWVEGTDIYFINWLGQKRRVIEPKV